MSNTRNFFKKSKHYFDILRRYLSDIVYGATDGIITTFVVVSGVEGAKLAPSVVLVLGIVNLFADGLSMGASSFLSLRATAVVKQISKGYVIPFFHASFTFFAFVIFGAIPLISFLIPGVFEYRFIISCIVTAITLFFVGTLRSFVSDEHWLVGGLEMLSIGGVAASIAYFLGHIVAQWIS